VFRNRHVIVI
ncbi:hypothetical protein CP8484711_0709B, partial [Chlamydia psittaci 84-8471/1]